MHLLNSRGLKCVSVVMNLQAVAVYISQSRKEDFFFSLTQIVTQACFVAMSFIKTKQCNFGSFLNLAFNYLLLLIFSDSIRTRSLNHSKVCTWQVMEAKA